MRSPVYLLSRLSRRTLILLLAALLVIEGGLVGAAVRTLRPAPVIPETAAPDARPGRTAVAPTAVLAPGSAPTAIALQPVDREPSDHVALGDLTGVADRFDVEEALAHIEVLTSPEYAGRVPGSPGGYAAGEYIAAQYAAYGLLPAGAEGYYQPFSVPHAEVTAMPILDITRPDGSPADPFAFRRHYAWVWGGYSGGGEADGAVFWLNNGNPSDYRGLDVRGEIVLVRSENAEEAARQALEHGAEGLLLLTETAQRITMRRTYREAPYLKTSLPTMWVSPEVASALLEGSGYNLDDLSFLYRSLELATRAHIVIEMDEPGEATARNVLGVLPGANPDLREQVLILGAHYDHLGVDPDGSLHAGANDDASGVGVLLEIARSWQAAGYVPERTVLFAAWDAEEQGLFGAIEYVRRPVFPLEETVGMIQLDMVGLAVTGTLSLDAGVGYGSGAVRWADSEAISWPRAGDDPLRQVSASAALYGVRTEALGWGSGSDHAPFLRAGVPAVLLIWDAAAVPYYHTPGDTLDTLQPERLREAGLITSHAAIALASVAPTLQETLADQVAAVRARDAAALAATLDASDPNLAPVAQAWLMSRPEALAQSLSLALGDVRVGHGNASAMVTASARDADDSRVALGSWPVQFVRSGAEWRVTWPVAEVLTMTHLSVQVVSPAEGDAEWAQTLDAAYVASAKALGLERAAPATVTLFPSRSTMEWLDTPAWDGRGRVLLRTDPLTATAVSLILDEFGLPPEQGEWLRVGLARWAETYSDPAAAREQSLRLASVLEPGVTAEAVLSRPPSASLTAALADGEYASAAWTMVSALIDAHGIEGVQRLCAAWGAQGNAEAAFGALNLDLDQFARDWESRVPRALADAREGITVALAQRVEAVKARQRVAFLETLDPLDPVYLAEEARWFDSLPAGLALYEASADLLSVEGDAALARVTTRLQLSTDDRAQQTSAVMRWQRQGDRWLLADRDWQLRETPHLRVHYLTAPAEFDAWLAAAERVYLQVSADLGDASQGPVPIKLYPDEDALHASWPQDLPAWRDDYVARDEACKLTTSSPEADARALARLLAQRTLAGNAALDDWLREGISTWQGLQAAGRAAGTESARYVRAVDEALPFDRLYAWDAMPGYADLAEGDVALFRAQSWQMVDQVLREHGAQALRAWLAGIADGASVGQSFERATGATWGDRLALWQQRASNGGVSAVWLQTAQAFDVQRVLADVAWLADAERGGRRAGSASATATAEWLVERMRALGLEPGAPDGSYTQAVPLAYSALSSMPTLEVHSLNGDEPLVLEYLQQWGDLQGGAAGGGACNAQIVWIPRDYDEGMRFGGRVLLKRQQSDPLLEAEQALAHGAGALILVRPFYSAWQRETLGEVSASSALPVAIVSEDTWSTLIKMAGMTPYEANTAAPANLLSLMARLEVPFGPTQQTEALNVIARLPGSDPTAPALVLAAHYDGLGTLPDGGWYPSANQNASGVAVLLEIARVLAASGQRPRNTLYLVAWGAEEMDLASSSAWRSKPLLAPGETLGIVNLDTVGASESYYLNVAGSEAAEGHLLSSLLLAGDLLDRRVSFGKADATNLRTPEALRGMGYPTVLATWPNARRLHTPMDTPDTLEPHKLATTGEVVALASLLLAW